MNPKLLDYRSSSEAAHRELATVRTTLPGLKAKHEQLAAKRDIAMGDANHFAASHRLGRGTKKQADQAAAAFDALRDQAAATRHDYEDALQSAAYLEAEIPVIERAARDVALKHAVNGLRDGLAGLVDAPLREAPRRIKELRTFRNAIIENLAAPSRIIGPGGFVIGTETPVMERVGSFERVSHYTVTNDAPEGFYELLTAAGFAIGTVGRPHVIARFLELAAKAEIGR